MKIINIHKIISSAELLQLLQEKLNPFFHKQRQSDVSFIIEEKDGLIEISQPELYEGFLFRIKTKGDEVQITRSEHYVDDINCLTLESILHSLFEDVSSDEGNHLVQEG